MHKFIDNRGDEWSVAIEFRTAKRVRDTLGFDLLGKRNIQETLASLRDPLLLVDVLYLLCQPQAEERAIDDVTFGRRLIGDPIEPACVALMRAIIDHFPSERRKLLNKLVDETITQSGAQVAAMVDVLTDEKIAEVVRASFDQNRQADKDDEGGQQIDPPAAAKVIGDDAQQEENGDDVDKVHGGHAVDVVTD